MAHRVLGIDPGSHNLGWAVVERVGSRLHHVASGTARGGAGDFSARIARLMAELEAAVTAHAPKAAALETAFAGKSVRSALVLGQARGAVLLTLARAGLHVTEYTPGQIKQAATGHGQADKLQVQAMVRRLLALPHDAPMGTDTSDALACAVCHAQQSAWQLALRRGVDATPTPAPVRSRPPAAPEAP